MAIEIVDFPIKNCDFPWQNVSSSEGRYKGSCFWILETQQWQHDLWTVHSSLWKIADVIRQCIPRIGHMLMFHSCLRNYQTLPNNKRKCSVLTRSHIVHLSYSLHPYCCWFSKEQLPIGSMYAIQYMVTFTINIPPMLAYIPYMDPMGIIGNDGCFLQTIQFFGSPETILIPSVNLSPRCQPFPNHTHMMLTWLGFLYV